MVTAGRVVAGTIAGVVAFDVVLWRSKRETVSCFCGRNLPWVTAGAVGLLAHFAWPQLRRAVGLG